MLELNKRSETEQAVLRQCGQSWGMDQSLLEQFPATADLKIAFIAAARELASGSTYDRARAIDLVSIAETMDKDPLIYRDAIRALTILRFNRGAADNMALVEKSPGSWEYFENYRMIEPRCSDALGDSALKDEQPDPGRDNEIAHMIFVKLPEDFKKPLCVSARPFAPR